ncbi:asparagine synthase-related protein [Pleionea sp. CnH1-48]|uniref:asparagine synthase-related protein n=1 Tax=Pleionea sp. CnH1-48 TaxID=2954494 RepID=UPI002097F534|nr:asparagine synthase-related protein [Pleionea sp. CnH1-48]MCO7227303.1 asparagine synthase-related protein [Pleionea sp. CnH1-48]
MSSICGIYNLDNAPSQVAESAIMIESLNHWGADSINTRGFGNISMSHLMRYNTPDSLHDQQPISIQDNSLSIVADARLDNREQLLKLLDLCCANPNNISDAQIILTSYQRWDTLCVNYFLGDFAFSIWDKQKRRLFCARDHMGCKPLYYYIDSKQFVFSSEIKSISKLPFVNGDINESWLAYSLCLLTKDKTSTFFKNIQALEPAHTLTIENGKLKKNKFWQLTYEKELVLSNEQEYVEALREKIKESVECRLRSCYPIGSELSGGLDSSFVSALAFSQSTQSFHCFSHVQSANDKRRYFPFKDEEKYISMLCDYIQLPPNNRHQITMEGKGAFDIIHKISRLHNSPALPTQTLYSSGLFEAARETGCRTLLTGFGGDHLVSSYGDGVYSDMIHRNQWGSLWREILDLSKQRRTSVMRHFLSVVLQELYPSFYNSLQKLRGSPPKAITWNSEKARLCIQREFADKHNLPNLLTSNYLYQTHGCVRDRELRKVTSPMLLTRLENGGLFASSYGIDYRHPLLDIRLLEFCLSLPSYLKQKGGVRRYLFRKSMTGVVPIEIQYREDKARHSVPTAISQFTEDKNVLLKSIKNLDSTSTLSRYVNVEKVLKYLEDFAPTEQPKIPLRAIAFSYMIGQHLAKQEHF